MDKYEFNIKVDQIKKLAAKKSFKEAAAIAKEMNWQKVKDWSTLAMVINVQEAAGDYLEARDMAILAYNRNLGGRKLVYKLTEFLIKLEDYENAEELYEEYEKMSQHDVNRYILYYHLRKAEKASDNELVEILEDYKEHEIDEKYMFELAQLYANTGRKEECIKTCDDIVLWFQDGVYVEKAIKLKKEFGVTLTNTQKKILENARNTKKDLENTKQILFEKHQEMVRIQQDDIEEALNESEPLEEEDNSGGGLRAFLKKAFTDHSSDDEDSEDESEYIIGAGSQDTTSQEMSEFSNNESESTEVDATESDITEDEIIKDNDAKDNITESNITEDESEDSFYGQNITQQAADTDNTIDESLFKGPEQKSSIETENTSSDSVSDIDKASISLKELIEQAKKKIEDSYDKISREDEQERIKEEEKKKVREMDIKVDIPNYSLYDTQNIQEELAKNLKEVLGNDDEFAQALRPHPNNEINQDDGEVEENPEDEQIEGQLSLQDWIEAVREKKYGNQDTREFSKAELDRMLDEKDEKSAAYERLIAEQKALAKAEGTEFNEEEARIKARTKMMIQAAKTDLAIRTGKATVKIEEAINGLSGLSNGNTVKERDMQVNPVTEQLDESNTADEVLEDASQEFTATTEAIKFNTAQVETVNDEILNSVRRIMEEQEEIKAAAEASYDEVEDEAANASYDSDEEYEIVSNEEDKEEKDVDSNQFDYDDDEDDEVSLSGDLAKIFRKYKQMPGLESQLAKYFETIDQEMKITTSERGNIIISGNSSSDKIDLARTIVRAINHLYPDNPKKIAKTTGESINHRGITKAMGKLRGTVLIVEGAGVIKPKRIEEMLACMSQDTNRMIVIFEDSDAEINGLLNFNPGFEKYFNHRIVLKQYTVNELVEMAKKFARKRQYEVDDNALLELYLKIDKLHTVSDNIKLDDIKQIINDAIAKSEKRASRRFFGGLKKKRGANGDIIFLSEADFKD